MKNLLTAQQVCAVLHIDRSTVYRMAEDGRLPAIRVGKQWRFPQGEIHALVADYDAEPATSWPAPAPQGTGLQGIGLIQGTGLPPQSAEIARVGGAAIEIAADLLGVMMVVTDMAGRPITPIANPCRWFAAHGEEPGVVAACLTEWRDLADDHDLTPRFRLGASGFECARAYIRSGHELTGMVLAGGVSPAGAPAADLYDLDGPGRQAVLAALPRIATTISQHAPARARA